MAVQSVDFAPSGHIGPWVPPLARSLVWRLLSDDWEYQQYGNGRVPQRGPKYYLFATPDEPHEPEDVFPRLRWGGQLVFVSLDGRRTRDLARRYAAQGFALEAGPAHLRCGRLPFFSPRLHYFVARKVRLVPPGQDTERFTYDVRLEPPADGSRRSVVCKSVPEFESVLTRLRRRFPNVAPALLERRARKFVERIFPTFLTREAGTLMLLQDSLPSPYCLRVPRVIDVERDAHGLVRRLRMNWLRNSGPALTQLEFARQGADLLRVIHDVGHIIHLDLRLDNFVITEDGVGFVDFGSAVRDDEDLSGNPLLGTLFEDLMRTSQIQRMLERMTASGAVTSEILKRGCHKVDKAVDCFFLAVQFNSPHANSELAGLIEYDPRGEEARALMNLTRLVLRPPDPARPIFRCARDILAGVERLQLGLELSPAP